MILCTKVKCIIYKLLEMEGDLIRERYLEIYTLSNWIFYNAINTIAQ